MGKIDLFKESFNYQEKLNKDGDFFTFDWALMMVIEKHLNKLYEKGKQKDTKK